MMVRDILFRGKRLDNGEWAYGWPFADTAECSLKESGKCVCPHDGSEFFIVEWDDMYHEYEERRVDPATVGQYTGLKDKNGKRIFEGDILAFVNKYRNMNTTWDCVVEFVEGAFVCRDTQEDCVYNHFDGWNVPLVEWEVIGNIHDNPELLKGERV